MTPEQFKSNYEWIAHKVTDILKLDKNVFVPVLTTQLAHETGYGKSELAQKGLNLGGIKATSKGKDRVQKIGKVEYAGYNSLESFAQDYARVLNLSYYDEFRKAETIPQAVQKLHESPYATDPKYGEKIARVMKTMYDVDNIEISNPAGSGLNGFIDNVVDMTDREKKMALATGALVLAMILIGD